MLKLKEILNEQDNTISEKERMSDMKKQSVNESYILYHNGRPITGFYTNAFPITKVVGTSTSSYISWPSKKSIKDEFKRVLSDVSKDDRFTKQDVQKLATMFKRMKIRKNESVNESKKEKDQIIRYLQGLGFDERTAKKAVAKSYNYISKAYRNTGTQYKGDLIANILTKKESVNEAPKKSTMEMYNNLVKFGGPMTKELMEALKLMVKGYGLEYVKREVKK